METKQPSGIRRHYTKFAGICAVFGLVALRQLFRGTLPADPAERAGAITADLLIAGLLFVAAAYFFMTRPKSPPG